ncbi:hypothetical protein [Nonomuraea rosea]|uniref:hypothetical protein n=1 Tax=Nonomuraea rosea TaxID=638574 RepID=UPI0031E63221
MPHSGPSTATMPNPIVALPDGRAGDIRSADTQPIGFGRAPHIRIAPPPVETAVVRVLRRQRSHLVVGTLLAGSADHLSDRAAKAWATRRLVASRLLPWRLLDEADPAGGWHTTSGLLVERYALYRHPGGWRLLGEVSWAARPRIATDEVAQAWADDVLRLDGPLGWSRATDAPGATTWYAEDGG